MVGTIIYQTSPKCCKKDDIIIFNDSVINKSINKQILKILIVIKVLLLRNTVSENFIFDNANYFDIIYDFEHRFIGNERSRQ
ncbi:hypothetical protein ECZU39_30280 [Escherichia coli]|nr:hypothetical protein ECZU39_30280 [Escherichia coli]